MRYSTVCMKGQERRKSFSIDLLAKLEAQRPGILRLQPSAVKLHFTEFQKLGSLGFGDFFWGGFWGL